MLKTMTERTYAMFKRLIGCVREYKKPTIVTLVFIILEAIIEVFIPKVTADLINAIEAGTATKEMLILRGVLLIVMAIASLTCGGIAGYACAKASAGFAKNLRHDLFEKISSSTMLTLMLKADG